MATRSSAEGDRRVARAFERLALVEDERGRDRAAGEHLVRRGPVHPCPLGEHERLGERLVGRVDDGVDGELHRRAGPACADVEHPLGEDVEHVAGAARSASAPPTMTAARRARRAGRCPRPACRGTRRRVPASRAASWCTVAGSIVLVSATTVPGWTPAAMPSGPPYAETQARRRRRGRRARPARRPTASAAVAATVAPLAAATASARAGVRL